MEELLEILKGINPDVDYLSEEHLIDGGIYDSFSIINLVSQISEHFEIELGPGELMPENFNSARAIMEMIERLKEE